MIETNTQVAPYAVWALIITEDYSTQCTGFYERDHLAGVFAKKPTLPELAPFIKHLPVDDMGKAIQLVFAVEQGNPVTLKDYFCYQLIKVPMNTPLLNEEF